MKGFGQLKQTGGNSGNGSSAVALSNGVNELSQLALWMAASLAGMVTAVLTARTPFFRNVMRRFGVAPPENMTARERARDAMNRPPKEQSLPMLAEAIVGSSKSAIASVFGPPRSAVVMQAGKPGANYWQADTWYYPLPKSGPLAMAIEFTGDDASRVEFLRAPEV